MTPHEFKHTMKLVYIGVNMWKDCFVVLWLRGVRENAGILRICWFSWRYYMNAQFILHLKLHIFLCYILFYMFAQR